MDWIPFTKKNYPEPESPWDGKTFVALRFKPKHKWDSNQVQVSTAMWGWNLLNGRNKPRPTHDRSRSGDEEAARAAMLDAHA